MVFSHYPPFINTADEVNHYDNYAEPGRSWLLDLAVKHSVEVIFSGHVHQFFYNVYNGVKLVCLPPTSFIRQDYAELFATSPVAEYGRDDVDKYSVCQVVVETEGFSLDLVPTFGNEWEDNALNPVSVTYGQTLPLVPHLRHVWFETRHLPYNGPMEEFGRKLARNDYPLLRLLQLGISTVRIPLSDLEDSEGLQRVHDWSTLGINFLVFCVGELTDQQLLLLQSIGSALAGFESVSIDGVIADGIDRNSIERLQQQLQCPLSIGKISTSANNADPTLPYAHSVSSGFDCYNVDQIISETLQQNIPATTDLVFQLVWGNEPAPTLDEVFMKLTAEGFGLVVNIRLANSSPALANFDDEAITDILRQSIVWAQGKNRVTLQCDTFEDVDRGYHPRHGLINRQGNIRLQAIM